MTFNITVPNAAQSPGLFPSQNNNNFQRLKDIINNDHNFTDSASAGQGIHKQCTFINRATPVGLPAGNGVLYSQADGTGASQLRWYNGASDLPITPGVQVYSGTSVVNSPGQAVIVPDPGYPYQAYWFYGVPGNNLILGSNIAIHYGAGNNYTPNQNTSVKVVYSGDNLIIDNLLIIGGPLTIKWTVEVIRLT